MGLFNKKKGVKKEEEKKEFSSLSALPKLPKLPELTESDNEEEQVYKLPSFPSNSIGKKFSSNTIKEAVAGEKEDEFLANDFMDEDEKRMMQEPARRSFIEEIGEEPQKSKRFGRVKEKTIIEPIFIRIDRFEEALKVFNEAKKKIFEIERILEDIRKEKEKEEDELKTWENEIRSMKEQIEKVDRDIFSKI